MKLILFIFFAGLQLVSAQQLVYKSGGTITTTNGERISTKAVEGLMAAHPEALELFKKGKSKQRLGNILIMSGAGVAVGALAIAYANDSDFPPATLVGVGIMIVGIPIKIGYSDKMKSAIDSYNGKVAYEDRFAKPELTICANSAGVGLKMTF